MADSRKGDIAMPYINIKAYPKDEEIKKQVVERINQVFLDLWGCPPEAVSIAIEEVAPADWPRVQENEIDANADKMMILAGKRKY